MKTKPTNLCCNCQTQLQHGKNKAEDTIVTCSKCGKSHLIWYDFADKTYRASVGAELDYEQNKHIPPWNRLVAC